MDALHILRQMEKLYAALQKDFPNYSHNAVMTDLLEKTSRKLVSVDRMRLNNSILDYLKTEISGFESSASRFHFYNFIMTELIAPHRNNISEYSKEISTLIKNSGWMFDDLKRNCVTLASFVPTDELMKNLLYWYDDDKVKNKSFREIILEILIKCTRLPAQQAIIRSALDDFCPKKILFWELSEQLRDSSEELWMKVVLPVIGEKERTVCQLPGLEEKGNEIFDLMDKYPNLKNVVNYDIVSSFFSELTDPLPF